MNNPALDPRIEAAKLRIASTDHLLNYASFLCSESDVAVMKVVLVRWRAAAAHGVAGCGAEVMNR